MRNNGMAPTTGSGLHISSMSLAEVERGLKCGEPLSGGMSQKDLGYLKIFFFCKDNGLSA